MDVKEIAGKVNIPCGVFDENGKEVILSSKLQEILNNYGEFFSFLGIEKDNPAYKDGISLEKRLFLKDEKKSFVFFVQKIDNFFVTYGIDITFNTQLIDSIIERSNVISQILSTTTGAIYIKELDGDFIYKNPAFEELSRQMDYLDDYFLENLQQQDEIVNVRKITLNNKERYIFEYGKVYEVGGKKQVRGFVLFDSVISNFFANLKGEKDILFDILDNASMGVLYLSKDCLTLKYYNRFAEDALQAERIERIEILGLLEPDVIFDVNTVKLINENLSSKGKYEVYNYKIPNVEGEFDFYFVYGNNGIIVFFNKVLPTDEQKAYRQFRTMFEYASDAIFLMKDATFVECNKKAEEILGCGKAKIIGKTPFDFSPKFQPNGIPSEEIGIKILDSVTLEGNKVFEWVHKKNDGSLFNAEVTLSKIQIGGYTYTQAIVRDISKRKVLIDLGRDFFALLSSENPVFVFDEGFNLILKNEIDCLLSVEDVKRYTISVLTKNTMVSPGIYSGNFLFGDKKISLSAKVLHKENKKFFLVKLQK